MRDSLQVQTQQALLALWYCQPVCTIWSSSGLLHKLLQTKRYRDKTPPASLIADRVSSVMISKTVYTGNFQVYDFWFRIGLESRKLKPEL